MTEKWPDRLFPNVKSLKIRTFIIQWSLWSLKPCETDFEAPTLWKRAVMEAGWSRQDLFNCNWLGKRSLLDSPPSPIAPYYMAIIQLQPIDDEEKNNIIRWRSSGATAGNFFFWTIYFRESFSYGGERTWRSFSSGLFCAVSLDPWLYPNFFPLASRPNLSQIQSLKTLRLTCLSFINFVHQGV